MTPTPPSPEDDILDLAGLGLEPKKPKASTPESDFEKELEALFAEDLTEPEIKSPVPGGSAGEDLLGLDDLAPEPAPAAAQGGDVLDLGAFAAAPAPAAQDDDALDLGAFAAPAPAPAEADDDVLDLGAFATGGGLDITPPEDIAGGKDGGIDTAALDDLISGLGETREPEPKAEELPPHDDTDMSDLLETLNVPTAAAPLAGPADEMLELSLGDLVEELPLAAPEPVPAAELPDLDISLPDISDPEPMALAEEDMGGDLNLSLSPHDLDAAPAEAAGQLLDTGDLDISGLMEGGMMEGLEALAEEPAAEKSLDPADLLDQFADGPGAPEAAPEPEPQGSLLDGVALGDVSIGVAAAAAVAAVAAEKAPAAPEASPVPVAALQELQEKLSALATQVMGGSVAVVRLEGQLAEKDQALAAMEQRLQSSHDEAHSLRRELSDLRVQLEETLRQRAQDSDKSATEIKERLALVEDRQIQLDHDVRGEIERAVPREAARVIREEIAALAASMHDE
jgi:pilus assembly protein FimV